MEEQVVKSQKSAEPQQKRNLGAAMVPDVEPVMVLALREEAVD